MSVHDALALAVVVIVAVASCVMLWLAIRSER